MVLELEQIGQKLEELENLYKIKMLDVPLVEAAVAAAVIADGGAGFDDVVAAAETSKINNKF